MDNEQLVNYNLYRSRVYETNMLKCNQNAYLLHYRNFHYFKCIKILIIYFSTRNHEIIILTTKIKN